MTKLLGLWRPVLFSAIALFWSLTTTHAETLTLAGSSTVQPVAEVLAQAFEKTNPNVKIDVHGGGSSVGISAPQTGLADVGMVSRALSAAERQVLVPTRFAVDGIGLIVHATNPLTGLTSPQVVDIYTGALASWQSLTGAPAAIVVINKEAGRATLELFEDYFHLAGRFVHNALIIGPNGQAIAAVAGNPDAIAYVSIGAADVAIKQGTPIKLVMLDGVRPSSTNVQNGTYQLTCPLHFVTVGAPRELAKRFLDFVLTPEGQRIVATQEFVPLTSPVTQR
ncbi:MAG: phosphate ABC transporter substrate-binding protein [Candidatus Binatia bacterium]